jgi:hypothetical protein
MLRANTEKYRIRDIFPVIGIIILFLVLTSWRGSLASDQEMIEHFNAHRGEFDELIQTYLEYGGKRLEWSQRPDVIELKFKTGVLSVGNGIGYWFDDPYSLEAARNLKQMRDDKAWSQNHFRKPVIITMAERRTHFAIFWLNGGVNWKDYYYFPVDPSVEKGRIKMPRELKPSEFHSELGALVANSTDFMYWWKSEKDSAKSCVMRNITPRWYIERCRGRIG